METTLPLKDKSIRVNCKFFIATVEEISFQGLAFLVKYNSSGVKQWTRQMGTAEEDSAIGIVIECGGNTYLTGATSGGLDGNAFSGGEPPGIFLVKDNSSGVKQ